MRWPFSRKEAATAEAGPQPAALPPRRMDWAGLPAIQRSVGSAPLTLQRSFGEDLASHPPAPALQPLGHHVSPQAAPGLVLAAATPQPSSLRSPAMVHRPRVQRKAGAEAEPETSQADETDVEAPVAAQAPVAIQPLAVQRLSQVDASPMVQPLASSAIRIAPPPAPVTPATPAGEVAVSRAADAAEAPSPRMTLGQVRRIGLGAPLSRAVAQRTEAEASEPALPLARTQPAGSSRGQAEPAAPPPPLEISLAAPSLHPAGRVALPVARTVQRTPAEPAVASEPSPAEPAEASPIHEAAPLEPHGGSQAPVQRLASVVETVIPASHPVPPLELPLAPRSTHQDPASAAHDSSGDGAAAASASLSASAPAPSLQRSPVEDVDAVDDAPAEGGDGASPSTPAATPLQRAGEIVASAPAIAGAASLPLTAAPADLSLPLLGRAGTSLPLAARTAEGVSTAAAAPSVQRSEALPAAGSRRGGDAIRVAGLGAPLVQRSYGSFDDRPAIQREAAVLPLSRQSAPPSVVALEEAPAPPAIAAGDPPSSPSLQRGAASGSAPLELPLAAAPRPRTPDLTVARQVASELVASGMATSDAGGGLTFQAPAGASAPVVAQRAGEESAAAAPALATSSSSSSAHGPAPAAAAPSVQQVAEEVLRRLRRELLVQRERSGKYHDDVS